MPPAPPKICPQIYHDTQNIYLEFAGHVLTFPYCEAGLNKALKYIPNIQSHPGYFTGGSNLLSKAIKGAKAKKVKLARGVEISDTDASVLSDVLSDLKEDKTR